MQLYQWTPQKSTRRLARALPGVSASSQVTPRARGAPGYLRRHIFVGRRGTRSWWFGMKGSGSGGGTCALFSIKRALSFSRPALYPSLCSPSPRKIRTNNVAGTPDVGHYAPASDTRQRATGNFVRPSRSPAYDPTDRAPSIHASTHHTARHVFPLSWFTYLTISNPLPITTTGNRSPPLTIGHLNI